MNRIEWFYHDDYIYARIGDNWYLVEVTDLDEKYETLGGFLPSLTMITSEGTEEMLDKAYQEMKAIENE